MRNITTPDDKERLRDDFTKGIPPAPVMRTPPQVHVSGFIVELILLRRAQRARTKDSKLSQFVNYHPANGSV